MEEIEDVTIMEETGRCYNCGSDDVVAYSDGTSVCLECGPDDANNNT